MSKVDNIIDIVIDKLNCGIIRVEFDVQIKYSVGFDMCHFFLFAEYSEKKFLKIGSN